MNDFVLQSYFFFKKIKSKTTSHLALFPAGIHLFNEFSYKHVVLSDHSTGVQKMTLLQENHKCAMIFIGNRLNEQKPVFIFFNCIKGNTGLKIHFRINASPWTYVVLALKEFYALITHDAWMPNGIAHIQCVSWLKINVLVMINTPFG